MKVTTMGLVLCGMISACASQTLQEPKGKNMKQLITLHKVDPKSDHIAISVTGYGCTSENQFEIEAIQNGAVCRVSIYRIQMDHCLRSPMPTSLQIPWDAKQACGKASIEIENPQKPTTRRSLIIPNNSK
jgi:hypothetical protein